MRDRLIELLKNSSYEVNTRCVGDCGFCADKIADDILADGWMRPPVKVGDKVYIAAEITQKIVECTVIGYWMCEGTCSVITDHGTIYGLSFDKTVFTSREEALSMLQASCKQVKGGGEG